MGDTTGIEWTDATWNPLVGCSVISPGCTNCYAMKMAGTRLKDTERYRGLTQGSKAGPVWTGEVRLVKEALEQPLKWRKPRRIFVNSMSDLFHEDVQDQWIDRIFAVMALCPQHTFQVLTKRPERMHSWFANGAMQNVIAALTAFHSPKGQYCKDITWWPLPNVWLGVSVEDQKRANERIPFLLDTPAAVRWISAEPLLGAVDLCDLEHGNDCYNCLEGVGVEMNGKQPYMLTGNSIDWVVVGGESGARPRIMLASWAKNLRDQCVSAGVPFNFKQWGGQSKKKAGRLLDGQLWDQYPEARA